jgi:hypothetical protein
LGFAEPPLNLPPQGDAGRGATLRAPMAAVAVSAAFADANAAGAVGTVSAASPITAQAGAHEPMVLEATRDAGVGFFYAMPCRVVDHCEPVQARKLTARTLDGGPLPDWLKFDASTATFFGIAPNKTRQMKVKVSAAGAEQGSSVIVALNFAGAKPSQ